MVIKSYGKRSLRRSRRFGRTIKLTLNKYGVNVGAGFRWLRIYSSGEFCGDGDEIKIYKTAGQFVASRINVACLWNFLFHLFIYIFSSSFSLRHLLWTLYYLLVNLIHYAGSGICEVFKDVNSECLAWQQFTVAGNTMGKYFQMRKECCVPSWSVIRAGDLYN